MPGRDPLFPEYRARSIFGSFGLQAEDSPSSPSNAPFKVAEYPDSDEVESDLEEKRLPLAEEGETDDEEVEDEEEEEEEEDNVYDDVYFDSEDEQQPASTKQKPKNTDMFFDPKQDNKDEAWLKNKIQEHTLERIARRKLFLNKPNTESHPAGHRFDALQAGLRNLSLASNKSTQITPMELEDVEGKEATAEEKGTRQTDAILTCPLCFTTLCFDCQQHEKFSGQFRAMFVENCRIVKTERYRSPTIGTPEGTRNTKKKKKKKEKTMDKGEDATTSMESEEYFHPVRCGVCDTHVGMQDETEIVHFFNIIAQAP